MWRVTFNDEFDAEFLEFSEAVQEAIVAKVFLLRAVGPQLGRPEVDTVKGSKYPNMKELRVQVKGAPWRILFAFDPHRQAILLVGGNKAGDKRWYKRTITVADDRYRRHLERI